MRYSEPYILMPHFLPFSFMRVRTLQYPHIWDTIGRSPSPQFRDCYSDGVLPAQYLNCYSSSFPFGMTPQRLRRFVRFYEGSRIGSPRAAYPAAFIKGRSAILSSHVVSFVNYF